MGKTLIQRALRYDRMKYDKRQADRLRRERDRLTKLGVLNEETANISRIVNTKPRKRPTLGGDTAGIIARLRSPKKRGPF